MELNLKLMSPGMSNRELGKLGKLSAKPGSRSGWRRPRNKHFTGALSTEMS